jgi:hypothetical protein
MVPPESCFNIFQMSTRGFNTCNCKITNIFCMLILVPKVDLSPEKVMSQAPGTIKSHRKPKIADLVHR